MGVLGMDVVAQTFDDRVQFAHTHSQLNCNSINIYFTPRNAPSQRCYRHCHCWILSQQTRIHIVWAKWGN